jgi:hypothetical protein
MTAFRALLVAGLCLLAFICQEAMGSDLLTATIKSPMLLRSTKPVAMRGSHGVTLLARAGPKDVKKGRQMGQKGHSSSLEAYEQIVAQHWQQVCEIATRIASDGKDRICMAMSHVESIVKEYPESAIAFCALLMVPIVFSSMVSCPVFGAQTDIFFTTKTLDAPRLAFAACPDSCRDSCLL